MVLSVADLFLGSQDVEAAVLESLMIGDAGSPGTFWPEDHIPVLREYLPIPRVYPAYEQCE